MALELPKSEYQCRLSDRGARSQTIDLAEPHIELRYGVGRAWITLITNDGDRFQTEAIANGQPISFEEARSLAHRVADERGIAFVVVPG
jgi:hypothetical protein